MTEQISEEYRPAMTMTPVTVNEYKPDMSMT